MPRFSRLVALLGLAIVPALLALASPEAPKSGYNPKLAPASDEAQKAIRGFQHDKSLSVSLWAAEPMLAHPVAFTFDEKGRCYVAESFRIQNGVTDTRGHMYWLDDDLACRTVADRVAMYRKHHAKKFHETYEIERERVRLLEDTTGSGIANKSTVFRDDFGRIEDGIAAGLLARKGNVYFTCIPDLWMLKDTKGTGEADVRKSLATGFGVHTGFYGHDLHGLTIGPDGRLYFSIGDRGLNVTTKAGKHLYNPDSGAVIRCELDGSNMELFATGLRNPQELTFDDFGNLFTVDNNSDSGDQARFVHVVQGSDSGWRMGYQYETAMHDETVKQGNRGPWNYEKLWVPGQTEAAYTIPPVKNFSNGPSGFTFYPGVGLNDKYKNHFFLCNFSGSPNNSGVFAFTTKPKGASFELVGDHKFLWNVLTTDCEFGPDGAFYVSDWINGWGLNGMGRIYKVVDQEAMKNPAVAEARDLLAEGLEKKSNEDLVKLLGHPHRRIRQEAQFALTDRGKAVLPILAEVASSAREPVARRHAVWAIGTMARKHGAAAKECSESLVNLTRQGDNETRGQAARMYGECTPTADGWKQVVQLLQDPNPRVRLLACEGLANSKGSSEGPEGRGEIIALRDAAFRLLANNDNKDPILRHAAMELLARRVPANCLTTVEESLPASVRLGIVVALRRSKSEAVASYLSDSDPKVVAEAARAVNDEWMTAGFAKLASLVSNPKAERVVTYRALNANFLLGEPENAQAVAHYAARPGNPSALRALAVRMLGQWAKPTRRDYVTGATQNIAPRPGDAAAKALTEILPGLLAEKGNVRREAITATTRLEIKNVGPMLAGLVADRNVDGGTRVEALRALDTLKDAKVEEAARVAVASADARLRTAGRSVLIRANPAEMVKQLRTVLAGDNVAEQQGSFALLATHPTAEGDALVEEWLDKLSGKQARPELALDILEAAGASKSERLKRRLAGYENARSKTDDIAKYRETLFGGDARRGRDLFINNAAVQCQRCHRIDGQGGDVGPPANGAGKQTREYLLEAIVVPNKAIAKGYESILITTLDGKTVTGVLKGEDDREVRLMTAEGKAVTVAKADIDDRRATKSAMPEDIVGKLSKRDTRDLVEFLSGLKAEWKK